MTPAGGETPGRKKAPRARVPEGQATQGVGEKAPEETTAQGVGGPRRTPQSWRAERPLRQA
uniref:Uncharacterized protein n=1 Tax=Amphimedon queenslandica TaxID=400682 RepID=A0A1X7TJ05_AMPQE